MKNTDEDVTYKDGKIVYEPLRWKNLIYKIANQIHSTLPIEDLVQYGWIGVSYAYKTYNPDSGKSFKYWISWQIHNEILKGCKKDAFPIRNKDRNTKKDYNLPKTFFTDNILEFDLVDDTIQTLLDRDEIYDEVLSNYGVEYMDLVLLTPKEYMSKYGQLPNTKDKIKFINSLKKDYGVDGKYFD